MVFKTKQNKQPPLQKKKKNLESSLEREETQNTWKDCLKARITGIVSKVGCQIGAHS